MDTTTFRWLLPFVVLRQAQIQLMDVVTAYLYGHLKEPIWMQVPDGFDVPKGDDLRRPKAIRLLRALYGLKQSGRSWYQRLRTYLKEQGFQSSDVAPCIFVKSSGQQFVIVAIYVDDLNLIGTPSAIASATKVSAES